MGSERDRGPDDIEIRHLRALVALAQVRHFGRAAAELGIAQSTLSRTIAQLERLAGVPLLEPSRTRITLSPAGRALLPAAATVLQTVKRGVTGARRTTSATLVLGLVDSLGYEWLSRLRQELTDRGESPVDLAPLSLTDGFEPLSDLVDVGIYPLPARVPDGLGTALLDERRPWVALAADHPLAQRAEIRLADLRGQPAIAPPAHDVWDRNVATMLRAQDLTLDLADSAVSMYEVLSIIAEGRGWTISSSPSNFHPWDNVALRPVIGVGQFRVAAVWARDNPRAEQLASLVSALRSVAAMAGARPAASTPP